VNQALAVGESDIFYLAASEDGGWAMATAVQVPVEVYLMSEFEPDAEYVDGHIEERPMGQFDHASWQQAIQLWFAQYAAEWNIRVRPELRVKTTKTNFRVADVVVFDRDHPIEQVLTRPPIAVFEVMSPEDRLSRMMKKLKEYDAMGIPTVMLIEPETGRISQFIDGDLVALTTPTQQLRGSRCSIDWRKVEELLD
jgi:Uma2 family endonuclease